MNKKRILTATGIAAILIAVIIVVSVIVRKGDAPVDVSGDSDFVVEATTDRYTSCEITTVYDTEGEWTTEVRDNPPEVTETDNITSDIETKSENVTSSETVTDDNTGREETGSQTGEQTSVSASEKDTTEAVTDKNPDAEDSKEQHSYAEFTFIKYNIQDMPADYNWSAYLERQGYISIKGINEFSTYATRLINNLPDTKNIKYIITSRGELDSICENESSKDSHLFDTLKIDYQTYLCKGVAVFKLKKIQDVVNDVTDKSVYALYYYSYLDGEQIKTVDNKISEIVSNFTGSDFDKIKAAHDYLCSRVTYDNSSEINLISHTAYGALINGLCVCEGYAKAYKLMIDAMNIRCNYVTSSVHAWNEVEYEGKWYVVDVTNDDTNSGYCYFMLGSDVLFCRTNVIIDDFILDEEREGQISQFGYADVKNSSTITLSETTYDSENRIKVYENPQ